MYFAKQRILLCQWGHSKLQQNDSWIAKKNNGSHNNIVNLLYNLYLWILDNITQW